VRGLRGEGLEETERSVVAYRQRSSASSRVCDLQTANRMPVIFRQKEESVAFPTLRRGDELKAGLIDNELTFREASSRDGSPKRRRGDVPGHRPAPTHGITHLTF